MRSTPVTDALIAQSILAMCSGVHRMTRVTMHPDTAAKLAEESRYFDEPWPQFIPVPPEHLAWLAAMRERDELLTMQIKMGRGDAKLAVPAGVVGIFTDASLRLDELVFA